MGAIHDELHALVDRLDDAQAARFAEQLRAALEDETQMTPKAWLEKTRAMRAKMREESPGVMTDSVETLREIRE
jgi:RecB family exonuclease